ncbi:MAG TPA: hypothetical protein VH877_17820 [Polyangia bacterium]|nr:hypothetical protein [Polyangia bacterium]
MDPTDKTLSVSQGAETEGAQASRNDAIAYNRTLPVLPAEEVPDIASGYRPASIKERRRLRKVSEDQSPDEVVALRQYAARGGQVSEELGTLVASPAEAARLADRIEAAVATQTALTSALEYTNELLAIARSDGMILLEEAHDEIVHRSRKQPQLVRSYDATLRLIAARSEAISEGLARRRSEQKRMDQALRKQEKALKKSKPPVTEESPSTDTPA